MGIEMTMRGDRQNARMAWFGDRCKRASSALGSLIARHLFRSTDNGEENALRVEEKLSLGPKKMLYLVSCREREFLIAAGADAIVSVVEVFPAEPVQGAGAKKASLTRMQKRERLP
jgi:flagellar biogenesis protein FliO